VTFHESGSWRHDGEREVRFTNIYRWTRTEDGVSLEHLREGPDHPVHLLELAQALDGDWRPVSPHVCNEDCYSATLGLTDGAIVLRWTIVGPRKKSLIECAYR
jgi:Family of unknown function (DUF6314)